MEDVSRDDIPMLDAGCGTGLQMEPLAMLGYRCAVGADLSDDMMAIARAKGLYDSFVNATLGETLPFETDHFAASLCCGAITPGHAPPDTFDELLRVTRPGGRLIFSMRDDAEQLPEYPEKTTALLEGGAARELFRTKAFASLPAGEPDIRHRVHVWEVLA